MGKKYYSFVGIYIFTFAAIGMMLPLLGQYMASIGFSGVQIGVVTATGTAVGIGASPFWGYCSHHSKDSTRVLMLLLISATLLMLSIVFLKQYLLFLLVYAAFSFFQTPIMPLTDAMSLQAKVPFGAVRKWGAIGFAAGVFLSGQLADATGLVIIFPLCAFGYMVAWTIMIRLKMKRNQGIDSVESYVSSQEINVMEAVAGSYPPEGLQSQIKPHYEKNQGSYLVLIRNKKLMALLAAAFFICGTNVANNTYFGFLYKDVGGSIAGIGIAFLLMCGSEAPFMAWAHRLSSKFTMEKMILFSMIVSALRYLWYSSGPAPSLLIGTFFLQGMVNGIVLVELVRYVASLVDPALIGMAMSLYYAISSSCSSIACQLIGGAILEHYSGKEVYLFFSLYNLIGVLLYIIFGLYRSNRNHRKEDK